MRTESSLIHRNASRLQSCIPLGNTPPVVLNSTIVEGECGTGSGQWKLFALRKITVCAFELTTRSEFVKYTYVSPNLFDLEFNKIPVSYNFVEKELHSSENEFDKIEFLWEMR